MENVTISQLQDMVDEWARIRAEIDEIEEIVSDKQKLKKELELKLIMIMQEHQMDKAVGKVGKLELRKVDYVTLPATEEDQVKFFNYLKETGQFDSLASIHHQKLQSWHKALVEEKGLIPVPGLEPMKTRYEIRKGR